MATATSARNESGRAHHELPVHEVLLLFDTDHESGLSEKEAAERRDRFGPNALPRLDRRGPIVRMLLQFHNPLIYVLLASAVATVLIGELVDASVILGVVVLNGIIGYVQEARAEKALDALVSMVRTEATVIRNGARRRIISDDVVPGDLIVLETGDKVPADLRLSAVRELQIDESALTGESVPVAKQQMELPADTTLGDRLNMAYSSSLVSRGRGRGIVVATGADTEIGTIHRLVGEAKTLQTPLTRKIARFSRALTVAILGLAVVAFLLGVVRGEGAADMLTAAVALAVAAIPEGLPAVVTITLAIGVARMARRRAIIRKLPAVETLGSTTVIGTDKTGTLTRNEMTVTTIATRSSSRHALRYNVTGAGYAPEGEIRPAATTADSTPDTVTTATLPAHPALHACLLAGVLCNDSRLTMNDDRYGVIGDPTEAALITAAAKAGIDQLAAQAQFPRLGALPFDSGRGYMATLHRRPDGSLVAYLKGAVERMVSMAAHQLDEHGHTVALEPDAVIAEMERLASSGLRVLALASMEFLSTEPEPPELTEELFTGRLTLLGLQAMFDPPRPDAIEAVATCLRAGIEVKMITGDHAATARAIAERFGLGDHDGRGVVITTGRELAAYSQPELAEAVRRTTVFARVSPEQKLRLVEAMQADGHVVAMTGDGVNDAPALRRADIGVSMGVSGTEVAKEASDMVLTDDDFASIEAAVEEGRGVFNNLRKFITFTLPTSMGQGLVVLAAIVLGTQLPILPVQVLWVNMITAVALGLVLAFEPVEPRVMTQPPVPPSRPLLTRDLVMRILLVSGVLLAGAYWAFEWELDHGASLEEARTVAVTVFMLVQAAYLLSCRSLERSFVRVGVFSNPWVGVGIGTMLALQALLTYAPWMNELFHTAPIDAASWLRALAFAVVAYLVVGAEKTIRRVAADRADRRVRDV
ncbi:HAD-IC family P-type ATPase [Phytoactinopolyspora halotolerans]|uniref:HAD-IC family P-type ATPase n=1 Tax=Phytoactinopolyspora halotolerans TaxID=1981512 RepID=A0A6L9S7X7_9ACTN|nr:HAD-IC family P-type ATPase [Phytoactinopolyspora halotolerans]NEE00662.1 HAD-IC family P-type ATPase [Phytoactinopolyspora halotolerans]